MNVAKNDKTKSEIKEVARVKPKKTKVKSGYSQDGAGQTKKNKLTVYLAILVVAAGVVGYYFLLPPDGTGMGVGVFSALGVLFLGFLVGGGLFFTSQTGHNSIRFVKEARIELRKVFWPSTDETKKMTILVVVVMFVVMVFLMFVDWGLKSLISFILSLA